MASLDLATLNLNTLTVEQLVSLVREHGSALVINGTTTPEGYAFHVCVAVASTGNERAVEAALVFERHTLGLGVPLQVLTSVKTDTVTALVTHAKLAKSSLALWNHTPDEVGFLFAICVAVAVPGVERSVEAVDSFHTIIISLGAHLREVRARVAPEGAGS